MTLSIDLPKKLSKELGDQVVQKLVKELGVDIVKNLGQELPGAEIEELIAKHGILVVKWLGQELAGNAVKDILNRLAPDALNGMQDISGSKVQKLLDYLGDMSINILAPALKGKGIQELCQLDMFIFDPAKEELLKTGQGAVVRALSPLVGKERADIENTLLHKGFTKSASRRGMEVWTHLDGSVVRIKFSAPALKPPRSTHHLVKEISKNPGRFRPRRDIFAKVADNGAVIPAGTNFAEESLKQWFTHTVGRVPHASQIKAMMLLWANAGHITIMP